MKKVPAKNISQAIAVALPQLNCVLTTDLKQALQTALQQETSSIGKSTLTKILKNAEVAKKENLPICQDTGLVEVFIELGQEVQLTGGSLTKAINQGVKTGYRSMRKSIVRDPLQRVNTKDNIPAVIYTEIVPGQKIKIHLLAKGGGAENKSALKMFPPTINKAEIKKFVLETIQKADAAACPPLLVGIGIGGSFDYCPLLAKKSLLRKIGSKQKNLFYKNLEAELLEEINKLNIGPAGYGGKTTALAVHITTAPCHIASLPVAVNLQCHAARHASIII